MRNKQTQNYNKKEKKILDILLNKISIPVAISLEKELILKSLELNNKKLYEKAKSMWQAVKNKLAKVLDKFSFLKKIFTGQATDYPRFFLERFKSRLYSFIPEEIIISDNSRNSCNRTKFDPAEL